ncbi:MAG: hypothetical protein KKA79_04185 [Nanoarchaeota archaeon]|nr:hypothetical protein [Nanoarchaeota archaeon]MCG2718138.1 hypothetical protein [Nanoarchaeota archaeon]
MKEITIHKGSRPILIYSLHNCSDWNEWGTREINEMLHEKERFYSFIYSGVKVRYLRDTKDATYSLIDEMLNTYGKIGLISLHRRKNKSKINLSEKNFFELGTLKDKSLDSRIKTLFKRKMSSRDILFDDNLKFTGGKSIKRIHNKYIMAILLLKTVSK